MKTLPIILAVLIAALPTAAIPSSSFAGQQLVNQAETFLSLTHLDEMEALLAQGITIEKVFYTDGYGFSTSEFTTTDPAEIASLWEATRAITLGEPVNEGITDWYPQIVFFLSDGSIHRACFDAHWLEIGGRDNYEVHGAEGFWRLTAELVEKYSVGFP